MEYMEALAKFKEGLEIEIHTNDEIRNKIENKREQRKDIGEIKRGDTLYISLGQGVGSEQNGTRYGICIQNNVGNDKSPTIIIACVTSRQNKTPLPTHVPIPAGMYGLPKDSVVLLEQVRTIDKKRIIEKRGHVDELMMRKIDKAKEISMGDLENKYTQKAKEYAEGIVTMDELLYNIVKFNNQDETFCMSIRQERLQRIAELRTYCEKNNLKLESFYNYDENGKSIREDDIKVM